MKQLLLLLFGLCTVVAFSQESESEYDEEQRPLLNVEKDGLLQSINVSFDMRLEFLNYHDESHDLNYTEFRNRFAFGIGGKITDKVEFRFRNRFNKEAELQTLDLLDGSVELAYVDIKASPKTNLQFGKMFAYFGGFEYEFSPMEVMIYNDIQDNLLNYVTGIGVTHQISDNHEFGFQALNSRTMAYEDIYEGNVPDNVHEPSWPLALVVNWRGSFFDNKFQTIYSYSHFRIAKGHATTNAITLGNRFQLTDKWALMYDFNYSGEQLDTKGIVTETLGTELIALDATYLEHWIRTEYEFSPNFSGILTAMTSSAYGKNILDANSGLDLLRRSYGIVPTLTYKPFQDINVKFFVAYGGRLFTYSGYSRRDLGIKNYDTHEVRFGLIAPLRIF